LLRHLALSFGGQDEPISQVVRAIGSKKVLLVLDNYEHLLEAATLCSQLLQNCPKLKLLLTSRERLNLAEEWLFALEGLAFPEDAKASQEAFLLMLLASLSKEPGKYVLRLP
jgi:predicted ATPase